MAIKLENIKIEESWKEVLKDEFLSPYFLEIKEKLVCLKNSGVTIYPPGNLIFNAFNLTPFDKVKVVILGQDPYHEVNQAMGLSFSVPKDVRIPPSLINIFKEINSDLGINEPNCGDLTFWAKQGVLLLNTSLTVIENKPNSHSKIGWQILTDKIIELLGNSDRPIVFILWGNNARMKKDLIKSKNALILESPHPSPFSANRGFFGCNHFIKTNDYLKDNGLEPIDWKIENI